MNPLNISFAGAGRVAGALCQEFYNTGFNIELIVSGTKESGKRLADSCNADWSSTLSFPDTTDLIVISVPDHKLTDVLDGIDCSADTVVAHTAGSYGLDIFPGRIMRKGVFYPLQTFTAGRDVDFRDLPLLLECSDKYSSDILEAIAESVGGKVYNMDAGHRKYIHLAAVFVCNFTNHMLTLGQEISGRSGLTGDILIPLIKETFMRAVESGPEYSQTGPAVRNDQNTIEEHIKLLSFSPGLQEIYRHITRSITDYYKVT